MGRAGNQPRLQHRSQVGKHQILKALLLRVIEKKFAQQIAGKRMNAVPLEPRTLARSRQPDRKTTVPLLGAGWNWHGSSRHIFSRRRFGRRASRQPLLPGRMLQLRRARVRVWPLPAADEIRHDLRDCGDAGCSGPRFNGCGCCGWFRGRLRRGLRLRSRRAARLDYWGFGCAAGSLS